VQYQSDYVLRLIEQMGSLIRRALERLGGAQDDEPYELAQEVIGLALDMDASVVSRLAPESLQSLLELQNHDDRVLELVARALDIEAEALDVRLELSAAQLRRDQAAAVRLLLDPTRAN